MKKTFKGFTLIECIVALALLGVASLTMAQIYARVAANNRDNHLINTSLSNQMAYVEKYTESEAVPIYFGNADTSKSHADNEAASASTTKYPPHKTTKSANNNYITIVRVNSAPDPTDASKKKYTAVPDETYSFPTDIYVLKSRDGNDKNSSDAAYSGQSEDQYNLRYKYVVGHSN